MRTQATTSLHHPMSGSPYFSPPERVLMLPTEHPNPSPRPTGQAQSLVVSVTSALGAFLFLLLLTWILTTTYLQTTQGNTANYPSNPCTP